MLDFFNERGFKSYLKKAKKILAENFCHGYTKPSPSLYPHQWNWDSGFIAIGYAHYDFSKAISEICSLFENQWENGMVPQIVFNPKSLGNYFPEPDFWQVPKGRLTSGITMPPLHAISCLHIYLNAKDQKKAKDFLNYIFPKLLASHNYFYQFRDPLNQGLVYIRHPWESGLDNSPNWDEPLANMDVDKSKLPFYERKDLKHGVPSEQRPSDEDYDRYVFLVDLFRKCAYEETEIFKESPFLVQDVLFNSILCRANQDLIEIGNILGRDVKQIEEWLEKTKRAICIDLWSEQREQFDPFDLLGKKLLPTATAASFMPLFALAANDKQSKCLYDRINSVSFCALHQGNCFTIPNFDMSQPGFDPKNYWRGPVWININWMLSQGLKNYGFKAKSDAMKKDIIQLPIRFGFHEYYDSITGKGHGSNKFSWTAALFIDLVYEYYDQDKYRYTDFKFQSKKKIRGKKILNADTNEPKAEVEDLGQCLMESISELKKRFYDMNKGLIDYISMKKSSEYAHYVGLTGELKSYDLNMLKGEQEKIAFWINLYNTLVVHGIAELDIISSVREVANFFSGICYKINNCIFSPDDIEHGILRMNSRVPYKPFRIFSGSDKRREFILKKNDPRIHFALVCGSRSCAPIRYYESSKIYDQLNTAAENFINSSEIVILPEQNKIMLSQIFKWYKKDFGTRKKLFEFLLRYLDEDEKSKYLAEHMDSIKVEYLFYDWNLNH